MIRRIILDLDADATLDRAKQEAIELAGVKQTNVYFQCGPHWYRTLFTPPRSAMVTCEKVDGTPTPIVDFPPRENSPTTN